MITTFTNLCLFIFLFAAPGLASKQTQVQAAQKNSRAIGWHWYNEIHLENPQEEKAKESNSLEESAIAQLTILRNTVQEAKARAILYPTIENVKSYVVLQNLVMEKARMFTSAWKQVLLEYPELDYGILHPTQNSAQHVMYAQLRLKEAVAIKYYSEKYGLLFFYRGGNLLDQELAPTIERFLCTRQNFANITKNS